MKKIFLKNLSHSETFRSGYEGVQFYNIGMKDCRTVTTKEFIKVYNEIDTCLSYFNNSQAVLIVCAKGVNRSISMAIAYGIIHTGLKYDEALSYIEDQKNEKYDYWICLNNMKFRHILQNMESNTNNSIL